MTKYLKKCKECKRYGLENAKSKCSYCGGQLINPAPAKFSMEDKYGKYRREYFREEFDKRFKRV